MLDEQRKRGGLGGMRPTRAIACLERFVYGASDLDPVERPESPYALPLPRIWVHADDGQSKRMEFTRSQRGRVGSGLFLKRLQKILCEGFGFGFVGGLVL